jgi:hypothetical protein
MLIAIDAKDYKKPVDVKGVEEFHGLLEDWERTRVRLSAQRGSALPRRIGHEDGR